MYLGMDKFKDAEKKADQEAGEIDEDKGRKPFDLKTEILGMVKGELLDLAEFHLNIVDENGNAQRDWDNLFKAVNTIIPVTPDLQKKAKAEFENAADQEFAVADAF